MPEFTGQIADAHHGGLRGYYTVWWYQYLPVTHVERPTHVWWSSNFDDSAWDT